MPRPMRTSRTQLTLLLGGAGRRRDCLFGPDGVSLSSEAIALCSFASVGDVPGTGTRVTGKIAKRAGRTNGPRLHHRPGRGRAMLGWLWGESASGREVVMYTRAGCHLCDEAWDVLDAERRRFGFELRRGGVGTDTLLAERFGQEVPVVTVDGEVRFRGRVNAALLRRLLRGHAF